MNASDRYIIFIDFETRSRVDLRSRGGRVYAADPETDLLCAVALIYDLVTLAHEAIGWSHFPGNALRGLQLGATWQGRGTVGIIRPRWVDGFPDRVGELVEAGAPVVAHNANAFDRHVWDGLGYPPPRRWIDTMDLARRRGLPGSLDKIGQLLYGVGKDKGGLTVLKRYMQPQPAKEGEPYGRFREPGPMDIDTIVRYCARDVMLMAALFFDELAEEHVDDLVLAAHQRCDERGVPIDVALVERLLRFDAQQTQLALAKAQAAGVGPTLLRGAQALRIWFRERGWDLESVDADAMESVLARTEPGAKVPMSGTSREDVRAVAEARLAVARVTAGKLVALLARVSADDRYRGWSTYYGAHTGRWTSTGAQLHNFPRQIEGVDLTEPDADGWCPLDEPTVWPELVEAINREEKLSLTVADLMGSALRNVVKAPDGRLLYVLDFSAIEARVLLWLAGDEDGLRVYVEGRDPYKAQAAAMFGIEESTVTKTQRQAGKVAVLACIAEGSPVLTLRGWVPIEGVESDDFVWDGLAWVAHNGLIFRGIRECIEVEGVWMTEDHEVLTADGWVTAGSLASTPFRAPGTFTADGRCSTSSAPHLAESLVSLADVRAASRPCSMSRTSVSDGAPNATPAGALKPSQPASPPRPGSQRSPTPRTGVAGRVASALRSGAARTLRIVAGLTTAAVAFVFTRLGWLTQPPSLATSPLLTAGTAPSWSWTASTTNAGTSPVTSAWRPVASNAATRARTAEGARSCPANSAAPRSSVATRDPATAGSGARVARRTYDLVNAGPRHRFQVGRIICHNCGFQGGDRAVANFAVKSRIDLGAAGVTAGQVVEGWRDAHVPVAGRRSGKTLERDDGSKIVLRKGGYWKALMRAARTVAELSPSAVDGSGVPVGVDALGGGWNRCLFYRDGAHMVIELPSGRPMVYRDVLIEPVMSKWGAVRDQVTYRSPKTGARKSIYGGLLAENVTQAVARDLLAETMVRVEAAGVGLEPVLHVHDELVCEGPDGDLAPLRFERMKLLAEAAPDWARGLPLKVDGGYAPRWSK